MNNVEDIRLAAKLISQAKKLMYSFFVLYFIVQSRVKMNPSNRQAQYRPVYYLQRPESPKSNAINGQSSKNLSLTMSIGANQTPFNVLSFQKNNQDSTKQLTSDTKIQNSNDKVEKLQQQMKLISKQNASLKEQNEQLRRQLGKLRRENIAQNVRSTQKYPAISPDNFIDLRGTIKKQSSQIKDLKIKLDMVSKQCKMYEEIIDKMDERIKKLTQDNQKKTAQADELQAELKKLDQLKEKTNSLMRMYSDLESKFNNDQLQWMKWKQGWLGEKEFYLNRLKQLELMIQNKFS